MTSEAMPASTSPMPGTSPMIPSSPKRICVAGMRKASSRRNSTRCKVSSRKSQAPRFQRLAAAEPAGAEAPGSGLCSGSLAPFGAPGPTWFDATIDRVNGGCSSEAERLTVAQDVVGSIPTSRPTVKSITYRIKSLPSCNIVQSFYDCSQLPRGKSWDCSSIAVTAAIVEPDMLRTRKAGNSKRAAGAGSTVTAQSTPQVIQQAV